MDQSKIKMSIFSRGSNFDSKGGVKENEVANMGRNKGDDGFRGRPSHHWMMVSIQTSVSDSIFLFFVNFMLALIVLPSITKNGEIVR